MKVLYIIKNEDDTLKKLIEEQKKDNEVSLININENKNYDEIVDAINSSERVISW